MSICTWLSVSVVVVDATMTVIVMYRRVPRAEYVHRVPNTVACIWVTFDLIDPNERRHC